MSHILGYVIQILLPQIVICCQIQHLHFCFEVSFTNKALLKCLLSVLERCSREFSYSKMAEKQQGPTAGVCLTEVAIKRGLILQGFVWKPLKHDHFDG